MSRFPEKLKLARKAARLNQTQLAEAVGGLESIEGISLAREFLQSQEASL